MINLNEAQIFLKDIIKEAGDISLEYRKRLKTIRVEHKATDRDIVTEADKAVESFLRKKISEKYPDHAVLGEEEGETGSHDCRWIVDPIDGTIAFLHGQYQYSISIALEISGRLELAAVFAPALNDLFTAVRGGGAFLNGNPIHVSDTGKIGDSVFASGFPCIRAGMKETNLPLFSEMMVNIRDFRRGGSAALDLCFVACGQYDGYWEKHIEIYDVAAGILLVQEAGGLVTDYSGGIDGLPTEVLATNGLIHDQSMDVIRPFVKG
ncbi:MULTISPECIES: inositol monophosphatase family protein [unclassified Oceanispirochaeta]|uniref:inositol monophosphatase family protein n=1 Tax=unclassified Oceanispirochaeta TaxID=2635722 RepID=UPI000E0984AD|nr:MULTISPECIES: inositol monophosphatase family protein [unclassified Oceanispirochaeta]MBF9016622.1 inositol monophosphatase [Oceanispirochaeta sp. M2]NPD73173.1 inositol monophosphatase [Oceanispirochaeta sp. M1]RDG31269.1 inositol monophosphatase [Oceanispirochaeta sp. M1]